MRTMKMVSVGNLSFACISSPLIYVATSMSGAPGKGIAMSALLLSFGGGTTAGLMWATRTYVKSVHSVPGLEAIRVVTPTFFGGELVTEVAWDDVQRVSKSHPFATFEASGRTYYLDEVGAIDPGFQSRLEAALSMELNRPKEQP